MLRNTISCRFSVYNFIRRVEWDVLGEPMRRNVSYISHEGISGDREHDSGYIPKELFRTRGAHRKSHQGAIKNVRVATRRRIVSTLRSFPGCSVAFGKATGDACRGPRSLQRAIAALASSFQNVFVLFSQGWSEKYGWKKNHSKFRFLLSRILLGI